VRYLLHPNPDHRAAPNGHHDMGSYLAFHWCIFDNDGFSGRRLPVVNSKNSLRPSFWLHCTRTLDFFFGSKRLKFTKVRSSLTKSRHAGLLRAAPSPCPRLCSTMASVDCALPHLAWEPMADAASLLLVVTSNSSVPTACSNRLPQFFDLLHSPRSSVPLACSKESSSLGAASLSKNLFSHGFHRLCTAPSCLGAHGGCSASVPPK
jgi:hypothetical protein